MTPVPLTVAYGMNIGVYWGNSIAPWDWGYATTNPFRIEQVDASRFIWVSETGRRAAPDYWTWSADPELEPTWNRWRDGKEITWNLWTVVLGPPWEFPTVIPLWLFDT